MQITGNHIIDCALVAWFLAQVIKVVLDLILTRKFDWHRFVSSGGMPSSHSSFVVACTTAVARTEGLASPLFGVCVVIAAVVMYDACNVRRAAGEQAKVLNYIREHWDDMPEEFRTKRLNEHLGHTLPQVLMGALLGTVIGLAGPVIL